MEKILPCHAADLSIATLPHANDAYAGTSIIYIRRSQTCVMNALGVTSSAGSTAAGATSPPCPAPAGTSSTSTSTTAAAPAAAPAPPPPPQTAMQPPSPPTPPPPTPPPPTEGLPSQEANDSDLRPDLLACRQARLHRCRGLETMGWRSHP